MCAEYLANFVGDKSVKQKRKTIRVKNDMEVVGVTSGSMYSDDSLR